MVRAGKEKGREGGSCHVPAATTQARTLDFTHVLLMEAPVTGRVTEGSVLLPVSRDSLRTPYPPEEFLSMPLCSKISSGL